MAAPQLGQARGRRAPQFAQKFAFGAFSAWHCGQRIDNPHGGARAGRPPPPDI
jgi:hypothetical protein